MGLNIVSKYTNNLDVFWLKLALKKYYSCVKLSLQSNSWKFIKLGPCQNVCYFYKNI